MAPPFTLPFFSVCNICHDNRRSNWSKIKSQLILISIFFIAKDVEYFSMYLLVLCISGENCKFNSLAYLTDYLFFCCLISELSSLYVLHIKLLPDI